MILKQKPKARRLVLLGSAALALLGGTVLAVSASAAYESGAGKQTVTIGVKPDGSGKYELIVAGVAVKPGAPLPSGMTLPADFSPAGGCDLSPAARPTAMAIKGRGTIKTYTVMCGSAAAAPLRTTLAEGLASLRTMRASVATQPASQVFPETERAHALAAIDHSIREVSATLGVNN